MLSTEQCKKLLPSGRYTDEEVEEIRDALYALATLLVSNYIDQDKRLANAIKEKPTK